MKTKLEITTVDRNVMFNSETIIGSNHPIRLVYTVKTPAGESAPKVYYKVLKLNGADREPEVLLGTYDWERAREYFNDIN